MPIPDLTLLASDGSSAVAAQSLSAAIAGAYGLAFIGLWMQFRRRSMAVLARAWLLYGAFSAITPIASDKMLALAPSPVVDGITFALAMLAVVAFLDAALVIVDRRSRRRLVWIIGAGLAALTAVGLSAGTPWIAAPMQGVGLRLFAVAGTLAALALVLVARKFPGRVFLAAGLGFLLVRFGVGLVLELVRPGQLTSAGQPIAFTVVQLLTLTLAGYYMTAAAFAQEHEGTLRERVGLERRLARVQRMESIGRIAGNVAHDFNNVLAAAFGAAEALAAPGASGEERDDAFHDVQAAVDRGRALTRQLMEYSRPVGAEVEAFDPAARVLDLAPMVRRLVGESIEVLVDAPADGRLGLRVRVNPVQFDQVLLNLAANARDAMPDGGTLRLSCRFEGRVNRRSAAPPRVRILVADSGSGMSAEVAERAFDPFFTTKPRGKGTGLGLASAFSFAKHAGGDLSLETAPGAGTTFALTLPVE